MFTKLLMFPGLASVAAVPDPVVEINIFVGSVAAATVHVLFV
jgi:hypothetical protein